MVNFQIVEVSGCPFYGYHPRERRFFKIFFYNPWMLKRAADMLQTGAIMGQVISCSRSLLWNLVELKQMSLIYSKTEEAVVKEGWSFLWRSPLVASQMYLN